MESLEAEESVAQQSEEEMGGWGGWAIRKFKARAGHAKLCKPG